MIEFDCLSEKCGEPIGFSLETIESNPTIRCPSCDRQYTFPPELLEKFRLLKELIRAIQNARPILGRANIEISVRGHQARIPYYLLLTRMTTELELDFSGDNFQFRFFIDPLKQDQPLT